MRAPAVVFTGSGPDDVEVRDVSMPAPAPGQIQIRTRFSTISAGTEGWVFANQFTWASTRYPCVPGYERTGDIVAIGEGVSGFAVGDRVVATIGQWDGEVCPFWGSHAAVANTPAHEVYPMPSGADEVDASAVVVAQVGYNAAHRPALEPGDWVAVYGDGIIGQFGAQAARARGARTILVGHRPERLELGKAHSADHAVMNDEKAVERIRAIIGQSYVRAVIDTVQTPECQKQYMPLLEYGKGQIVYSGFTPTDTWASMADIQKQELTTHSVAGWTKERMEATLGLIGERRMRAVPLATHTVSYTKAAQMYRMIRHKSEPFMGIVIDWKGAVR
jgi:bacteriochlorophyllide a dehydrogenase